mmetsp:Transcript_2326/g.5424  ORF Transcript_2326/g.5424 Transcript_2326/m.5424 type:complete len:352 (-) Transcript_2326:83-1138(-)
MLCSLEAQHTRRLPHEVPPRLLGEGGGDGGGAGGELVELVEAGHHGGSEEGLAAARDKHVAFTRREEPRRLPNRHGPPRAVPAVPADAVVGPLGVHLDRRHAAAAVHDKGGDDEGRDLLEPLERELAALEVLGALVHLAPPSKGGVAPWLALLHIGVAAVLGPLLGRILVEVGPTDGAPDENAEAGLVLDGVLVQLGVLERKLAARHAHVHVPALPLRLLLVPVPSRGREPVELPGDVARKVVGPLGELVGPDLAVKDVGEKLLLVLSHAREAAEACHKNLLVRHRPVGHHGHHCTPFTGSGPRGGCRRCLRTPQSPPEPRREAGGCKAHYGGGHHHQRKGDHAGHHAEQR